MPASVETKSLHARVESEILTGHLAPGSRLDMGALASRLGVDLADLRVAALDLIADGLLIQEAGAALRIAPVSMADLDDLTQTRIAVETEALRRSIRAGDAGWEQAVRAAFVRLAELEPLLAANPAAFLDGFEACNAAFHTALVAACPLRRLLGFNARLYKQHQRYRRLSLMNRTTPRDVHGEHLALFEAALARDADQAGAVLAEHIGRTLGHLASGIRDGSWFGAAVFDPADPVAGGP